MSSEVTPAILVFVRALMLAKSSGASEIGIDHLLAALDEKGASAEPAIPSAESSSPITKLDMPLSAEAAAALGPVEDIPGMPLDLLRSVLLAAKS